jgi:aspartyl aminopeptidase
VNLADFLSFLDTTPSPFHAVANVGARLDAAGFSRVDEADAWPAGGRHYLVRGGSLVAWATPDGTDIAAAGFRIVGAHTDSPNLRIKPQPDTGRVGWSQLRVEIYGSPLYNSWLDRDLGLSGRVVVRGDGGPAARLLHVDRPVLRVPQLAIHLDRDVNTRGLVLNPQEQIVPVWATGAADRGGFARFLAKELEVDENAVLSWDVMTHDVTPAAVIGRDGEFISSGRLDNLCSCLAATEAITNATGPGVAVMCLFDHEEVGSASARGAESPLLPTVMERIALPLGAAADREAWHRALARSVCLSADMAHATHPNYPDRHDPDHLIAVNGGPVIKANVNQRYATDAPGAALFADACARAGVPVQRYSHRNDIACGSTIGPITAARLGITTVDVGAPQLAMHSARELMGAADPDYLARALTAFLAA